MSVSQNVEKSITPCARPLRFPWTSPMWPSRPWKQIATVIVWSREKVQLKAHLVIHVQEGHQSGWLCSWDYLATFTHSRQENLYTFTSCTLSMPVLWWASDHDTAVIVVYTEEPLHESLWRAYLDEVSEQYYTRCMCEGGYRIWSYHGYSWSSYTRGSGLETIFSARYIRMRWDIFKERS